MAVTWLVETGIFNMRIDLRNRATSQNAQPEGGSHATNVAANHPKSHDMQVDVQVDIFNMPLVKQAYDVSAD